ncbi:MAG: glutamate-5-semialdehyde dehydrogenase [Endozoicomonadaceae bacterium]|nr:glutamate-5-semialdehyde dehydrogenase [Endozoicomonadaceae bacterium]
MQHLGRQARIAATVVASADACLKNSALLNIAAILESSRPQLQAANRQDLDNGRKNGFSDAMLDRLEMTPARIDTMIEGLKQVATLSDPVGNISDLHYVPSGIQVGKMRVPLGVVGIIYEFRPSVLIESISLCLKSGNATILRGGSETIYSSQSMARCVWEGLKTVGLPLNAVQMLDIVGNEAVHELITMPEYVDVIVPRASKALVERISREARMKVIKHLGGICHVYIDDCVDPDKAERIAINAKTHRYSTGNAMETLLVHKKISGGVLPVLANAYAEKGVELRGCSRTRSIIPSVIDATKEDWSTEYLAPVLSIKVVDRMEDAITHINHYGSHHTDAIVTENFTRARKFLREVDSSSVMVNASTRFAEGFEYGLGAEVGISTGKLHARGPVGLEGLTSEKYVVLGDGHIRQ